MNFVDGKSNTAASEVLSRTGCEHYLQYKQAEQLLLIFLSYCSGLEEKKKNFLWVKTLTIFTGKIDIHFRPEYILKTFIVSVQVQPWCDHGS